MLRVYAVSGQELIAVQVEKGSVHVAGLKNELRSRHGFPVQMQELLYNGIRVNDGMWLPVAPCTTVDLQLVLLSFANPTLEQRQAASNELRYAFESGRLDVVQSLLEAGADTNTPDAGGHTALMRAAEAGNQEKAKLLLKARAWVDWETRNGTALIVAAQNGHTEMLQLLLQAGAGKDVQDDFRDTALICAARGGHTAAVQLLVDAGANTELTNLYRDTPLKYAAEKGDLCVVQVLLRAGANRNRKNCYGRTALMYAAKNGKSEIVQVLLEAAADQNLQDNGRRTASQLAAKHMHTEIVQMLARV
ncbi:unnamed protein product [Symbiodinium pilosum]|uniref:Ankyrin repeat domain-containing protein 50 n=1 Tax=Symbiodinium pilosum TaxID=2952 RepID=A0A812RWH6_SYMPI|nr:unnamed protein product [Symbiodinium pilosum]